MKKIPLRTGLMATTICGLLLTGMTANVMMGGVAHAQDTTTNTKKADDKKDDKKKDDVTEVTVVGSRIRKDTYNSASPVEVITRQETTALGMTSPAEILQSTAVTGGSSQINNSYGNYLVNGGSGTNTIGLRGLGPGRTLVLINGKRVDPAGSGGTVSSADLNTLPSTLIGHVEVLRDGASAIYGSDAIGGVINIVTRKVSQPEIEIQGNLPEHPGGGQSRISIVDGKTWGNFNLQGSLEVYQQDAIKLKDRSWSKCQIDDFLDPASGQLFDDIDPKTGQAKCFPLDDGNGPGVTINTLGTASTTGIGASNAVGTKFTRWRPNSSVTTGAFPGYEGVGGGANDLNVRDTYNDQLLNEDTLSPDRNYTAFIQGTYKLPDFANSEIYGQLLMNKRKSQQTGFRQLSLDYPDAPGTYAYSLIPTQLQNVAGDVAAAGASTLFTQPIKDRAFIGFGNTVSRQDANFSQTLLGIRGELLPYYLTGWRYDASLQYSDSNTTYMTPQFLIDRIHASLFNCPTGSPAGCVSAPALTPQTVAGQLPADWVNYILQDTVGRTKYLEETWTFDANGPLFKLPAGDVEAAFGIEHRWAQINDQPDPNSVAGNLLNYSSAQPTTGHTGTNEAYVEFEVPILKDLPLAKNLSLELAGRYTEDSKSGTADTYKAGLVWQPFSWLTLRGSQGTSFRAPALFELFQGAQSGFLSFTADPCSDLNQQNNPSPNRVKNCAAEVPADFEQKNAVADVSVGGALNNLKPETSVNNTYGFVFRPDFLPSFLGKWDFAVDYFDIQISNGIAQLGGASLLNLCYDSAAGRAGGSYCTYSTRNVDLSLTVQDGYVNVSNQGVKGYDYDLRWTEHFGDLYARVDVQATNFKSQTTRLLPTDPVRDTNGFLTSPAWTGSANALLTYRKWTATYGLEFVGAQDSSDDEGVVRGVDPYVFYTKNYFIHTLSVEYNANDNWSVLAGVRNLTDEKPPQVSAFVQRIGNTPLYSGYDLIGRQIYFDISKKF